LGDERLIDKQKKYDVIRRLKRYSEITLYLALPFICASLIIKVMPSILGPFNFPQFHYYLFICGVMSFGITNITLGVIGFLLLIWRISLKELKQINNEKVSK